MKNAVQTHVLKVLLIDEMIKRRIYQCKESKLPHFGSQH